MSASVLVPIVLKILSEGMVAWNTSRATKFKKKHHKILTKLHMYQNILPPDYTDADLDRVEEELLTFLEAYHVELKEDNKKYK